MKLNKKGAALMQVLLITVILAGIATMLLRASLSRTTSARRTRRMASAQVLIQNCMAEVNSLWANKSPEAFRRDWNGVGNNGVPYMYCSGTGTNVNTCPTANIVPSYECTIDNPEGGAPYKVKAYFVENASANDGQMWQLTYEITQGSDVL